MFQVLYVCVRVCVHDWMPLSAASDLLTSLKVTSVQQSAAKLLHGNAADRH